MRVTSKNHKYTITNDKFNWFELIAWIDRRNWNVENIILIIGWKVSIIISKVLEWFGSWNVYQMCLFGEKIVVVVFNIHLMEHKT